MKLRSTGTLVVHKPDDEIEWMGKLGISNLEFPGFPLEPDSEPFRTDFRALLNLKTNTASVTQFDFAYKNFRMSASGKIEKLSTEKNLELEGKVTSDLSGIAQEYAQKIDPDAQIALGGNWFKASGSLAQGLSGLEGELGIQIASASFQGLVLGPAKIVGKSKAGKISIDPIHTTLNSGALVLAPQIETEEFKGIGEVQTLVFDSRTSLEGAVVDDALSQRVLSFVAPVLADATRVHGDISVDVVEARIPLAKEASKQARFDGVIAFNDVMFTPGPLSIQLCQMVGIERPPTLRLNDPVTFVVENRRVSQTGFAIPIGNVTRIEMAGWVDFDKNIALDVSLPFTSRMVGNVPILSEIAQGTRLTFPIRGTLAKPKFDKEAFQASMKSMGQGLAQRGIVFGLGGLLDLISQPRRPNNPADGTGPPAPPEPRPPRMTPEERKAERLRKQEERREQQRLKQEERRARREQRLRGDG